MARVRRRVRVRATRGRPGVQRKCAAGALRTLCQSTFICVLARRALSAFLRLMRQVLPCRARRADGRTGQGRTRASDTRRNVAVRLVRALWARGACLTPSGHLMPCCTIFTCGRAGRVCVHPVRAWHTGKTTRLCGVFVARALDTFGVRGLRQRLPELSAFTRSTCIIHSVIRFDPAFCAFLTPARGSVLFLIWATMRRTRRL